jgi:methionyl-tRNA synthetase
MYTSLLSPTIPELKLVIFAVLAWSLFWKGFALWRAARGRQKYWFVVLLLINTLGLLEIIFLAFFQKTPQKRLQ